MAFKKSYTSVEEKPKSTSFLGNYSLSKAAGLDAVGKEAYVIPLDMQNGYTCIPVHTLRKNGKDGFKNSFYDTKIVCHRFDPETGERSEELPLCCQLAQEEKDRIPEKERSSSRAISFTANRAIIPVLVLSNTEDNPNRKPSMKKLSLNGISFSFIDMAEVSYNAEIRDAIISDLEADGVVENKEDMDPEELYGMVQDVLQSSIIKITNVKSEKNKSLKYVRTYKTIRTTNTNIGELSGEYESIRSLCGLLAGKVKPEKLDKFYEKFPLLKEINNQVIDYLTLFDDKVDTIAVNWTDEELQSYYDKFIGRQEIVDKYKDVNKDAGNIDDEDDDDVDFIDEEDTPPAKSKVAPKVVKVEEKSEDDYDYSTSDLEDSPVLSDVEFSEEDYTIDEDDDDFGTF